MNVPRILGIDPGLRVTGFGVIELHGKQLVYVASGCIKSNDKESLPERIKTLFAGISEVIATYAPNQAAVEKVFVNGNPQTTLLLGEGPGGALCAPAVHTASRPLAAARRPTSAWNSGPRSPTSPMSPSTSQRGAGSAASTSIAAFTESGLAL